MTESAPENVQTPTFLLANTRGLLLSASGGWTTDPSRAKAFSNVTQELFDVASLFNVCIVEFALTSGGGRIDIYSATPASPAIEIRKSTASPPRFRLAMLNELLSDGFVSRAEIADYLATCQMAFALADLLP